MALSRTGRGRSWSDGLQILGTIELDDPQLRLDVAALYAQTDLAA
jgi:hypothetical protein